MKQFETILFPQDMIQDTYKLHWNIIPKSTRVTWNVGPYKLIRLPGHPNLNLIWSKYSVKLGELFVKTLIIWNKYAEIINMQHCNLVNKPTKSEQGNKNIFSNYYNWAINDVQASTHRCVRSCVSNIVEDIISKVIKTRQSLVTRVLIVIFSKKTREAQCWMYKFQRFLSFFYIET